MKFDSALMVQALPELLGGAATTIWLSVVSILFGLVLGIVFGIFSVCPIRWLTWLARLYADAIRGTPLLVQIFILYYALPPLGITLSAPVAGILGLGVNSGGYIAEIVRAGIQSIPRGQVEAARGTGLTYIQVLRHVVLPQAMILVLPPLTNEFITLVKATSLVSTIAIAELLRTGQHIIARTFAPLEIYLGVAGIYLAINLLLRQVMQFFENYAARTVGMVHRVAQEVGV
jgi:polar amino acid transport system permease protein